MRECERGKKKSRRQAAALLWKKTLADSHPIRQSDEFQVSGSSPLTFDATRLLFRSKCPKIGESLIKSCRMQAGLFHPEFAPSVVASEFFVVDHCDEELLRLVGLNAMLLDDLLPRQIFAVDHLALARPHNDDECRDAPECRGGRRRSQRSRRPKTNWRRSDRPQPSSDRGE
jgi:hypothetical protein